jgi:hypothetical protein
MVGGQCHTGCCWMSLYMCMTFAVLKKFCFLALFACFFMASFFFLMLSDWLFDF